MTISWSGPTIKNYKCVTKRKSENDGDLVRPPRATDPKGSSKTTCFVMVLAQLVQSVFFPQMFGWASAAANHFSLGWAIMSANHHMYLAQKGL